MSFSPSPSSLPFPSRIYLFIRVNCTREESENIVRRDRVISRRSSKARDFWRSRDQRVRFDANAEEIWATNMRSIAQLRSDWLFRRLWTIWFRYVLFLSENLSINLWAIGYRDCLLKNYYYFLVNFYFQSNQLKKDMALRIIKEYDRSINKALRTKVNNKIQFKVLKKFNFFVKKSSCFNCSFWFLFYKSKLDTYRNCDNVWTLLFNGIEITFGDKAYNPITLDQTTKVKVVACEAKSDKKVIELSFFHFIIQQPVVYT